MVILSWRTTNDAEYYEFYNSLELESMIDYDKLKESLIKNYSSKKEFTEVLSELKAIKMNDNHLDGHLKELNEIKSNFHSLESII